jgi:hypothetical protein
MPTVLRIGPYRIGFYAADAAEPPHVHVKHGQSHMKIWLEQDVRVAFIRGFADHEANFVRRLVVENRGFLLEQWNEFFRHTR